MSTPVVQQYVCTVCGTPVSLEAPAMKECGLRLQFPTGRSTTIVLCTVGCRDIFLKTLRDPDTLLLDDVWRVYFKPRVNSCLISYDHHGDSQGYFKGSAAELLGHAVNSRRMIDRWLKQCDQSDIYGTNDDPEHDDDDARPRT